jgi:multiple sugar transport system permease protein
MSEGAMDRKENSAQGDAALLLKTLVGEGLGDSGAQRSATQLPRIKLVLPSAQSPVAVRRKQIESKEAPLRDVLPQIVREVSQRQAENPPSALTASSPMADSVEPVKTAPVEIARAALVFWPSRLRQRFNHRFGKDSKLISRKGERAGSIPETSAIYQAWINSGKTPSKGLPPQALAWAMLLPALLMFALFAWLPMGRTVALSFMKVAPTGAGTWIGLANYERAFLDPVFLKTLLHALSFCFLTLGIGYLFPIMLALFLNERPRFGGVIQFLFFLPFLTPLAPAVIAWRWVLDQGYGLVNGLIAIVGIGPVPWLDNPGLAMFSIALVFIWKTSGWSALIYLTSLRSVPEELYEIAELEGVSPWKRIWLVSFPHLKTTMIFLFIMQVAGSMQVFTEAYLLTAGGPAGSTEMIVPYLYKRSFLYLDLGYASAMAVLLFAFLFTFTAARLRRLEEEF